MKRFAKITMLLTLLTFITGAMSEHNWNYEMKKITTKTSNPDLVNLDFTVERVSRGVYALSGEFKWNIDIREGDNNELELISFRSPNSDGEYKELPLSMERQHWFEALNNHFKSVLMETFKDCSDLPYFEGQFTPPFEKKTYVFDKCQISQKGLPSHLEVGTYKLVLLGYGEAEWELELLIEIELNE